MNLDPRNFNYEDGYDYDYGYDNDFDYDYGNDYSAREQAQNDMLDYTQELYESGRIDKTQRDEMRMGA